MTGAIIILIILLTIFGGIYMMVRFRRPGPHEFRDEVTGDLVPLKMGTTHVSRFGPEDGPVLVCVHGLSTPSYAWDPIIPFLTELGYRVITYDHFGRGHSDRPMSRQNAAFFLRHLDQLLVAERVTGKFTLMGYSMGGMVATAYAARSPERLDAVILLASGGLDVARGRFNEFTRKWPIIGDWVQEVFGARVFRATYNNPPYTDPVSLSIVARMCDEVEKSGTLAAILSSTRGMLAHDQNEAHRAIATADLPVLAIWGHVDDVIPISSMGKLTQLNRNVMQIDVEGADHGLPYTHPASVAEAIEDNL